VIGDDVAVGQHEPVAAMITPEPRPPRSLELPLSHPHDRRTDTVGDIGNAA